MKLEALSRGGNSWFIMEYNRMISGDGWEGGEVDTNENKITTQKSKELDHS